MWIGDAVVAVVICFYLPFVLIKQREDTLLSSITALQLFPVIATVVASAVGATVAGALPDPHHAVATIIASYVLWGLGMPATGMVMVIYFQRLAIHKMPPREVIVSVFLPLGPPSLGGYAVMQLGKVALDVFPKTQTIHELAGPMAYSLGVILALILWGFALLWGLIAVAMIAHQKRFPFNMGWWG